MKKSATTATNSPAPAKKPAKPRATKKAPAAAAPPAAPEPVTAVPSEPAVSPPAAAVAGPARPTLTTIVAKIDIGFGNALYLRGAGAGLSWDRGLLMESVASDQWRAVVGDSSEPILFKVLVNDLTWSAGEDYSVVAGGSISVTPTF